MTAAATKPETVTLAGVVGRLYCQRPDFCAGVIDSPRAFGLKFTIRGYVKPQQRVTLRGKFVEHKRFGRQFEASELVYDLPADPAGVAQWLAWNVDGVGHITAVKLTDEFGADLMPLCAADPGQVAATCGVPLEIVNRMASSWQSHATRIAVQSKLAGFGLTQHQVEVIVSKFGGTAATIIEDNPYLLLGEVDGLGFTRIDEIAIKCGVARSDERRVTAALQWVLRCCYQDDGCTAIPKDVAILKVEELLGADAIGVEGAAGKLALLGRVKFVGEPGESADPKCPTFYVTPHCFKTESLLWTYFAGGREPSPFDVSLVTSVGIGTVTVELDDTQAAAVALACRHRCVVVTGGAGSGKTLVAKAIARSFIAAGVDVHLAAPTGKAARRLTEVVGRGASTIHRLLGFNPDGGFVHNENNKMPGGLYLIDEISMVDVDLMASLVRALPDDAALVLIGDENQLPPVGPGAVLRDLLAHEIVPAARLMKCHRQAGTLKTNAAAVNEGRIEPNDAEGSPPAWVVHKGLTDAVKVVNAVRSLYSSHLRGWGFDPVADTQFMTAKHAGKLGTKFLNKYLQWLHQGTLGVVLDEPDETDDRRPVLYIGDKVIHTKNNYQLGVMNGTVGIVTSTQPLCVEYDDGEIEYPDDVKGQVDLAYCLSVHKMQGSEIPCAVVVCHKANWFLQTRNWIYTAATRARKTCVIIGDADSARRAAERADANRRTTLLQVFANYPGTRPVKGGAA